MTFDLALKMLAVKVSLAQYQGDAPDAIPHLLTCQL